MRLPLRWPVGLPTPQANGAAVTLTHRALCTLTYGAVWTLDPLGLPPPGPTDLSASQTHGAACKALVFLQPRLMGLPAPRTLGSACDLCLGGCLLSAPTLAVPSRAELCRAVSGAVGAARPWLSAPIDEVWADGGCRLCSRLPGAGVSALASPVAAGKGRAGPRGDAPAPSLNITHWVLGYGNWI